MLGLSAFLFREWSIFSRSKLDLGFSLLPPLVLLFFFALNMNGVVGNINGVPYVHFIVPGIAVMTLLNSTVNAASRTFNEGFSPMLRELFSYPSNRSAYVNAKLIASTVLAVAQALVFLLGGSLIFDLGLNLWIFAQSVLALFLIAVAIAGLSLCLALATRDMGTFLVSSNILGQVLIWTSTIFYPLEAMPRLLRWLALMNPLTYGTELLRGVFGITLDSMIAVTNLTWLYIGISAGVAGFLASYGLSRRAGKVL
jgi:ABC-2 type transport system permease protein